MIYCFPERMLLFFFHFPVYLSTISHPTIFQSFSNSDFSHWIYYCYLVRWIDLRKNRFDTFHVSFSSTCSWSSTKWTITSFLSLSFLPYSFIRCNKSTVVLHNLSKFLSFLCLGIENPRVNKVILSFLSKLFNTIKYLIDDILVIMDNKFLKTFETKTVKHTNFFLDANWGNSTNVYPFCHFIITSECLVPDSEIIS